MKSQFFAAANVLSIAHAAYVWPSQYDSLDDLLYLQDGYIRNGQLSDQVQSCGFGAGQPGIQKSAEWVRTAFHDAATHDTRTGLGGLDASIQFELDRGENLGAALNNTLADISSSYSIRSSASDLLALAMVMAVDRCGGLYVPLRLGRIDATAAGIEGVPQPSTDLKTTQNRFSSMGFNQQEMITLVACGHTLGGVHSVDHPEIVTEGGVRATNVAHFDNTTDKFDNAVVTEYMNSRTQNPLVVAKNKTLNSDKRIFGADRNRTMTKLADPTYFKSQCESLLGRMIDTVPAAVKLTDPWTPADIRPDITSYQLRGNKVALAGRIRMRTSPSTGRDPSNISVSLIPRNSKDAAINTTLAFMGGGSSFGYRQETFNWYEFNQTLSAGAISAFNIQLKTISTGAVITNDNAGTGGFPLNADILWQRDMSCAPINSDGTSDLTVVAAIRDSLVKTTGATPRIVVVQRKNIPRSFMPKLVQETVQMKATKKVVAGYRYYTATAKLTDQAVGGTSFDIVVGNSKLEFLESNALAGTSCS